MEKLLEWTLVAGMVLLIGFVWHVVWMMKKERDEAVTKLDRLKKTKLGGSE